MESENDDVAEKGQYEIYFIIDAEKGINLSLIDKMSAKCG